LRALNRLWQSYIKDVPEKNGSDENRWVYEGGSGERIEKTA
jgi:hypothetical protein